MQKQHTMKPWLALILAAAPLCGLLQAQSKDFTVALTGDSNWHRRISIYDDPGYAELIQGIRAADARFTNFETLIHPVNMSANPWAGGGYGYSPPWMVDEVKWVGFNLLSVANNHAFDYGADGLLSSIHALEAAGIPYAGAGENLGFARAPGYLDTRHGRVALVACVSSLREGSLAGAQHSELKGRPGVNPLRVNTTYTVDAATFEALRKIAALRGGAGEGDGAGARRGERSALTFAKDRYQVGDKLALHTAANPDDLKGILASIRGGKRQAEWVIASIHAHETAPGDRDAPAEFLVAFAHAAIDAGADVFIAHGPMSMRGIELYKGKPVFYGLGNFVFDGEAGIPFLPAESYESQQLPFDATTAEFRDASSNNDTTGYPANRGTWESVVAHLTFSPDHRLKEIGLDPISLGWGGTRSQRGHPLPASPELGKYIIEHLAKLSAPLGTTVEYAAGKGVVKLADR